MIMEKVGLFLQSPQLHEHKEEFVDNIREAVFWWHALSVSDIFEAVIMLKRHTIGRNLSFVYDVGDILVEKAMQAISTLHNKQKSRFLLHVSPLRSVIIDKAFNSVLTQLMHEIDKLEAAEISSIASALAQRSMPYEDIMRQLCERITSDTFRFRSHPGTVLAAVADLRFKETEWAADAFAKAVEHFGAHTSSIFLLRELYAAVQFGADASVLDRLIAQYNKYETPSYFNALKVFVHNHFNVNPAGVKFSTPENIDGYMRRFTLENGFCISPRWIGHLIAVLNKYQHAPKVLHTTNGVVTPIYLPEAELALWPVPH